MKKRTALVIIIAALCLIFIPSCKRIPDTGITKSTTEAATTATLGPCAGGHSYVDGFCTECGKEFSSEGLEYKLSEDETYYIVSGRGSCNDKAIAVPSVYDQKPVREIGKAAFKSDLYMYSVILPDSVTVIGDEAFSECQSLYSVTLPNRLTKLGTGAFNGCTAMRSIDIPKGITRIEDSTFKHCSMLKSVVIPDSVTEIGASAFSYCYGLSDFTLPEGLERIEKSAFEKCKFEKLDIPKSLKYVAKDAFSSCNITTVNISSFPDWCSI